MVVFYVKNTTISVQSWTVPATRTTIAVIMHSAQNWRKFWCIKPYIQLHGFNQKYKKWREREKKYWTETFRARIVWFLPFFSPADIAVGFDED